MSSSRSCSAGSLQGRCRPPDSLLISSVSHYRRLAYRVTTRQLTQRISRDADDDQVLACALAAKADLIVSGDRDLLTLKVFRNIPIVTAAEAVLLATK